MNTSRPCEAALPAVRATGIALIVVTTLVWSGAFDAAPVDPEAAHKRWRREVQRRGVDPSTIENPLRFTVEMQQEARGVGGAGLPMQRLRNLQLFLFDEDQFPFDYDSHTTYTAAEAYVHRTGNCVSFTNLFISLARAVQIPVYAAVLTRPVSVEKQGDLIVVNNHLVAVYKHATSLAVFDFNRQRREETVGARVLDDMWITAIYLNNRGANRLLDGDAQGASLFLEAAVKLAPGFVPAYGNLGIVRRQLDDIDGAFEAYRTALEYEPRQPTILNNLAALYQSQGKMLEAETALRAADLSGATPYLMVIRGNFELGDGRRKAAMRLYRLASRMAPELPEPWLAIARVEMSRNRTQAAVKALRHALELDPQNEHARRMLDSLESGS